MAPRYHGEVSVIDAGAESERGELTIMPPLSYPTFSPQRGWSYHGEKRNREIKEWRTQLINSY